MISRITALAGILLSFPLFAMDAREIMHKVDNRDDGDKSVVVMDMHLIDKHKKVRTRKLQSQSLDVGDDSLMLMHFLAPQELKGSRFLTYDYRQPEKDDDQWIYLPELKKVKRVAANNKSGSFFGSDFSYADMARMPIDNYIFSVAGESTIDERLSWKIEAIPNAFEKKRTGYKKITLYVDQKRFTVVRSINVLLNDDKKFMKTADWQRINDVWVARDVQMTFVRGGRPVHQTRLKISKVSFNNQEITEDIFTVAKLGN